MFKKALLVIVGTVFLSVATSAQAILLEFDPKEQHVMNVPLVNVGIVISGLGEFSAPSLSTFDMDISYDQSILSFSSITFGDPILGDQLDLFGLGSITGVDNSVPGIVNLFELSLDLPGDLDILQAGRFTLAILTFQTVSTGISPLAMSNVILGDSDGGPLSADASDGSISVPEPATIVLMSIGLAGIGFQLRRKMLGKNDNRLAVTHYWREPGFAMKGV